METFKIGDVVMLKSKSDSMTVIYVSNEIIRCVYYNGETKKLEFTTDLNKECFKKIG